MKNKKKKRISLTQLLLMVFCVLTVGGAITFGAVKSVFGAAVPNFSYSGLSASDSGSSWSYNTSTNTLSGSATGVKGTCSDSTSTSSTVTIKNETGIGGTTLNLTFAKSGNGTFKINNSSGSVGSKTYTLAANGTVTVNVTSEKKANAKTTVTVKIDSFIVPSADKTTHFDPASNGKYTITKGNGEQVTCDDTRISITQSQADDYTISALPNSGYRFVEWLKNNSSVSTSTSYTFKGSDEGAIFKPVFTESSNATFLVNSLKYFTLNSAITAASNGSDKVIKVIQNGTVANGTYTIPSGITLLVPCDANNSVYSETSTNNVDSDSYISPSNATSGGCFARLDLAPSNNGTSTIINVEGTINVSSRFSVNGQVNGHNGTPSGKYGRLHMGNGSKIVLKNKSKLYAWGFVTGVGEIEALSGSTVFELMQIKDFRGGNHTSGNYSKVFPFNQYYIQNVEAPLKFYKGAKETLRTGFYVYGNQLTTVNFLGTGGMFSLPSSAADTDYILKKYDGTKDRLIVEAHGVVQLSSINVSVSSYNIQSNKYSLPLTNNISIYLKDNSVVTITGQNYTALPGVEIYVERGSTLNIDNGSNLYLFDFDQYHGQNYSGGAGTSYKENNTTYYTDVYPIDFSPTKTFTRKEPADAKLCVEGMVYVKGGLYTSAGNSNIYSTSENPGKIIYTFSSSKENETTVSSGVNVIQIKGAHGATYSGSEPDTENVKFYLASLKHGNGTFLSIKDYYLSASSEARNTENTFRYVGETQLWDGRIGGATIYQLKFVDPRYENFVVKYPEDGVDSSETFVFPTKSTLLSYIAEHYSTTTYYNENAFKDDSNEILFWDAGGVYFEAGVETEDSIGLKTMDIHPIFGGWINMDGNDKYLLKSNTIEWNYAVGLYKAETFIEGTSDYPIFKLLPDGTFDSTYFGPFTYVNNSDYPNGDNQTYFIEGGIVREIPGLVSHNSNIYYVQDDNHLVKNRTIYVSLFNDVTDIEAGYYYFDENGIMSTIPTQKEKPTSIHDGVAYVNYDSEVANNYGLFAYSNNLYYAGTNGVLVTSTSFYVGSDMINGCTIGTTLVTEGLYYFDEYGRMYDSQLNLITNGGQTA